MLLMTFSMTTIAQNNTLDNIEKTREGYLLTNQQIIELANYIEELRAENKRMKAKIESANKLIQEYKKQIDNYEKAQGNSFFTRLGDGVTGAGIASLLIIMSQGLD